jgi:hypothetical protein
MALPSVAEMEAFIRAKASELGIDPDTAVRVARSEGLAPGVWQARGMLSYGRERSYGPFQLHVAPQGHRGGLGNDMIAETGLDPADPANWQAGIDFALNHASKRGWGAWYGPQKLPQPITGMMGIGGQPVSAAQQPGAGTSMGGYAEGPTAVQARMDPPGLLDTAPVAESPGFGVDDFGDLGSVVDKFAKLQEEQQQQPFQWLTPGVVISGSPNWKGLLG